MRKFLGWPATVVAVAGILSIGWWQVIATLANRVFYWQGLALVFLIAIFVVTLIRQTAFARPKPDRQYGVMLLSLLIFLGFFLLNFWWLRLSILTPILTIICTYACVGLMVRRSWWWRNWPLVLLMIMSLPLLERLQRFVSFPFRLLTATGVSLMLDWLGIAHVSHSTVIATEQAATSVELPCSGLTSIYVGSLLFFGLSWVSKIRLSWQWLRAWFLLIAALVFFNIWRVFTLVYLYSIVQLPAVADQMHVLLGVGGFVASCWWGWKWLPAPAQDTHREKSGESKKIGSNWVWLGSIVFWILLFGHTMAFLQTWRSGGNVLATEQKLPSPHFDQLKLSTTSLSLGEQTYFATSDVAFSEKYQGFFPETNVPFSLLVVGSRSARVHHDPETCLQGLGHTITNTAAVQVDGVTVRQLQLNQGQDVVYYWYRSADQRVTDYSERVWSELQNPGELWILVEIGIAQADQVNPAQLNWLISYLDLELEKYARQTTLPTSPAATPATPGALE